MDTRRYRFPDRIIGEIDRAINVLCGSVSARRELPGGAEDALLQNPAERRESARLMRVNHSGEVAAQALYRGQALTARDSATAKSMRRAAGEELDHLAWCETRIKELGGHTSVFNPLWYAGSLAIGAVAGLAGDRVSLGFIAETERQVETHLRGHMDRLPAADRRSRAIVEQMTHDEVRHGLEATSLGGRELPLLIKGAMHLTSKLMTGSSRWA